MRKYLTFIAAMLGLSLLGLTMAHATNPNTDGLATVEATHSTECGTATVTVTVPDDTPAEWQYGLEARVAGAAVGQTPVQTGPGTQSLDLTFAEDENGGSVTVEYYFFAATEWDIVNPALNYQATWPDVDASFVAFDVDTDCEAPKGDDPVDEGPKDEEPKGDDDKAPEPKDEQPKDNDADDDTTPVASDDGELPDTGGNTTPLLIGAAALLVLGAGGLGLRRMLN